MELIQHIYVSAAAQSMGEDQLSSLLGRARETNERLGVTGMLLFTEGSFFQVLEGDRDTVERLYARIATDPRHCKVTKVVQETITERAFASWTMGFLQPSRAQLKSLLGRNDFFGTASCFHGLDDGRAKRLLEAFKDGGWRVRLAA
jgi:hypothetical protein